MRAVANGLYTSYVQEKIFSPLGLTRPRVGPSLHSQRGDLEVQQHSSYPSSLKQNIFTAAPALVGSGYGDDVDENYEAFMDWSISAVDYAAILAAVEAANTGKHPILNRAGVTTLYQQIVPGLTEGGSFTMGGLIFVISPANHTVYGHDGGYSTGGMNIATWVFSRDDGISGAIFMNMDDPNVPDPLGQFAFWNPSNLQAVLDQVTTWPAHGDLFPSYGIPSL